MSGKQWAVSPWRFRIHVWRQRLLPYAICVPWQPAATDGPYKAWRWVGREWFKRPWPEGRTRETYMKYRALQDETGGDLTEMMRRLRAEREAPGGGVSDGD